jgi:hypothetical protein
MRPMPAVDLGTGTGGGVTKVRNVQLSAFPELVADKPTGPILPSVFVGTNADLVSAVAPFYLTGSVMDCTYGEGAWWRRFQPDEFVAHDLHKVDGVDFTALPEADGTYDAVCFDPPYIPQGGVKDEAIGERFRQGFGLTSRTERELWGMIDAGFRECARVLRSGGYLLVKCMDYVNGKTLTFGHVRCMEMADAVGLYCHDLIIHHTGAGPGGHNIFDPKRARRHHSYLLVFRKVAP